MPKLQTPVLYDDPLDGLNKVRPLVIGDGVEQVIDLPVVDANVVDDNRFARGRLLRCDNNGVLLKSNHKGFTNIESITFSTELGATQYLIEFSQIVNLVLWEFVYKDAEGFLTWSDESYTMTFQELSATGTTIINFRGVKLYLISTPLPFLTLSGKFHGFYN